MGESVAYPAYARILATFPERRRGLANVAIDPGTRTGPAVGTLLGGLLMAGLGWRVFFLALGLGSMLWVVERTGQFYFAFLVAAMVALAGSAITIFGIGPVEQVRFRRRGYEQRLPAQTPPR